MGEHEFLKHLREDHDKQKKLGKQLVEAKDPQERDQLRKQFHDELYPHMIAEEASMFRLLKDSEDDEARDDGLEGIQEHHVAKIVLRELMDMDTDSEVFKAKAKVLDELNRHHIDEEEDDVFKHLKKLDDAKLDSLFEQYEKAEEDARK